jgi:hypothetical protein
MTDGDRARRSFLDTAAARVLALAVILAAGALIAVYHRDDLLPKPVPAANSGLNPEFVACRDQRIGQVDKMRSDGVIGDAQVEIFKERAMAYCAAQFPPDKPAAN